MESMPDNQQERNEWSARELSKAPSGYAYLIQVSALDDVLADVYEGGVEGKSLPSVRIPLPECKFTLKYAHGNLIFIKD